MYVHESGIQVRYGETDQMGVAHHANYLLWLEVARTDFLRAIGYRYRDLEGRGVILAVIEAHCRYRAPARYDDSLRVRTWVRTQKKLKLDFAYEILHEDGRLVAEGNTVLGCLDREGRPQPLPSDVEEAIRKAI
ncbi:MAG: acyl-CoA thioesterase [Planctomycetes bacterium]|nr:acyl-CoA thioesterase [Planctomycetota bacterium]